MNLQPHQTLAGRWSLLSAVAASVVLHGLLLWPGPPLRTERSVPSRLSVSLRAAVRPAAPVQEPERGPVAAVEPVRASRGAAGLSALSRAAPPPGGAADLPAPAVPPAEGALRALRYALAKGVTMERGDADTAAFSMTLQLHVLARRVVGVAIARSSGRAETDARVLAAFRAAAARIAMPNALPEHGFSVELELEAGDADRQGDAQPPLSG